MQANHAFAEINLKALVQNYQILQAKLKASAECAAVVKANAYGLGMEKIAPMLANAGCSQFFVATLQEAIQLRVLLPNVKIAVFYGALTEEDAQAHLKYNLVPCLNSLEQIQSWRMYGQNKTAFLHVDTGMHRLGLEVADLQGLLLDDLNITHLMTHLACAGDVNHPLNPLQLERFRKVQHLFPHLKASIANSSGIFLGEDFHGDLARPGVALYGANPTPALPNPMQAVVSIKAPILQIRTMHDGEAIGYNASYIAKAGSKLATLGIGYADCLSRSLSNKGKVWINGYYAPVVGIVSMDLTIIDISHIPENKLKIGDVAELVGEHISIDEVADAGSTISYELLTRIEQRIERIYLD